MIEIGHIIVWLFLIWLLILADDKKDCRVSVGPTTRRPEVD